MADGDKQRPVIRVRVVTSVGPVAEDIATKIGEFLQEQGYELIEQSGSKPGYWEPDHHRVFLTVR